MAVEALAHFEIPANECDLVVFRPSEKTSWSVLKAVLAESPFDSVIDTGPRTRLRQLRRLRQAVKMGDTDFDRIIIGDYYSPLMRHLAASNEHPILVDDGTGTIVTAKARVGLATPGRHRNQSLLTSWAARVAGLRTGPVASLTFFTMFDIEVTPPDQMIRNQLSVLRSRVAHKGRREEALLLGSPFVELDLMSESTYRDLVISAVAASKLPVTIIPHRRERPAKLDRLRGAGLKVLDVGLPIEIQLLTDATLPRTIYSFFSTANFTIHAIFGTEIELVSFKLSSPDIDEDVLKNGDPAEELQRQIGGALRVVPLSTASDRFPT